VEDNINVGNPTEPAEDDNGGCIVAKNNITAEQNLTAKNNLYVEVNAEVADTFKVKGLNGAEADRIIVEEDITITASKLTVNNDLDILNNKINVKDLDSTGTMTANLIGTDTEKVTKVTASEASVDKLTAGDTTLGETDITESITVQGTITAETALADGANNLIVNKADIETADIAALTGTTATIDDITGTNTVSSANIYQDGYKVPIIELVQSGTEYQLKISRIGAKPQS
jgi:hypothetical protein